jgi:hypothetical protein
MNTEPRILGAVPTQCLVPASRSTSQVAKIDRSRSSCGLRLTALSNAEEIRSPKGAGADIAVIRSAAPTVPLRPPPPPLAPLEADIDPRYPIRPSDGKVGHDAFAVIRETIRSMDMVAIGRLVLTSREHIIGLEPLTFLWIPCSATPMRSDRRTSISTTFKM